MFDYFDPLTPSKQFDLGKRGDFSQIVDLWQGRMSGAALPAWESFQLQDFAGWHPRMALSEVVSPGNDLFFRYFGSDMVRFQGNDLTGHLLSKRLPDAYESVYRDHFAAFLKRPSIALGFPPAASDLDKDLILAVLHLPLADDGHNIDRILHLAWPIPRHKNDSVPAGPA